MKKLEERLARLIATSGPICVAYYMAEANAHYYATRDPFGQSGDFITAPEISQMFGELIGLWLADLWIRAGRPPNPRYVELGPGRGTLAADALRAMKYAGLEPEVHFIETSPVLRQKQAERVPGAMWHDDVSNIKDGGPLLIIANEFFDALPARQLVATGSGWKELFATYVKGRFERSPGPPVGSAAIPPHLRSAPPGSIIETSPTSVAIIRQISHLVQRNGGAALIVDYGHEETSIGDTLQAVSRHGYADPWVDPGEHDLTVHVDFEALASAAKDENMSVDGPCGQGEWLIAMGIDARAARLSEGSPTHARKIMSARNRLVEPQHMGALFKAMALTASNWPKPAGF